MSSIRQAREIREIFGPVLPRLEEVEAFLRREMDQALPMVREVAGHVLGSGGKRLRPALVLLVSRLLGYGGDRDVRYGAVVEMIHTATLVHDDIIDGSDLRRGRPTANRLWGSQTAVLVGDWLYTRTMDLCLEVGDVEVMRRLTTATLRMTEGEILAERVRGRVELDETTYLEITRRKTAELFAAACSLPALFSATTLHYAEVLAKLGLELGLCFQLVDDLLDYTSTRGDLGKPVMADLREGRATLPLIVAWPHLDEKLRRAAAEAAGTGELEARNERLLLDALNDLGALDEVRARAAEHARRAAALAVSLPAAPERDALLHAARLLVERSS